MEEKTNELEENQQQNKTISKENAKIKRLEGEIELKLEEIKLIKNKIANHDSYNDFENIKLKVESFENDINKKRSKIIEIEKEAEKKYLESIDLMRKSHELSDQSRKKKLHSNLLLDLAKNISNEIDRILQQSKSNGILKEESNARKAFNQFHFPLKRKIRQLESKIKSLRNKIDIIKRYKGDS